MIKMRNLGFSLVETLLGIFLIGAGATAVSSVAIHSMSSQSLSRMTRVVLQKRADLQAAISNPTAWKQTLAANASFDCAASAPGCSPSSANNGFYEIVVRGVKGEKLSFDSSDPASGFRQNGQTCTSLASGDCEFRFQAAWRPICETYPCQNPTLEIRANLSVAPESEKIFLNPSRYSLSVVQGFQPDGVRSACFLMNGIYNVLSNTCRPRYAGKTCAGEGYSAGVISRIDEDGTIHCSGQYSGTCDPLNEYVSGLDNQGRVQCSPKVCPCRATVTWGACNQTCGGGSQTEIVNVTSPALNGGASCPVPSTRTCNTHSCNWTTGGFSACSATCNGGTQSRAVRCRDPLTGSLAPDSQCPGDPPPATVACNSLPCTWNYSDWGSCSVACGGDGTQSRSSTCRDTNTGNNADESLCGARVTTQTCNNGACAVDCIGQLGACSVTCGGGSQVYSITTAKVGSGLDCPHANGDVVYGCNPQACTVEPGPSASPAEVKMVTEVLERDYDGWSNGTLMCSRFHISNWMCDGYSICSISNIKYIRNTEATCSVSATVTHIDGYDGYVRRPIAPTLGEFGEEGPTASPAPNPCAITGACHLRNPEREDATCATATSCSSIDGVVGCSTLNQTTSRCCERAMHGFICLEP